MKNLPLSIPPRVKPGDKLGVAAPAGPFDREKFHNGVRRLEQAGFHLSFPPGIYDRDGFLAGPDRNRADIFNRVWADRRTAGLVAARGGYGSMRILPDLNYGFFRDHPKPLVGFSDISALILAVHKFTGLVTFHGPVVTSLSEADERTLNHLTALLTGDKVFPLGLEQTTTIVAGRAEGTLLGGNLTLLVHLLKTDYLPDPDGAILFLEDVSEAPYRLDRKLYTLRLSGFMEKVRGVILGDFRDCGPEEEVRRVLESFFSDFHGPVCLGFPIGHDRRNLALPIGPRALLDTEAGVLDVLEPYLS